jgi:CRISPR/Cas system-associated protein Cas10 (large subunit of type III CRISPR-Cas system)
MVKRCGHCGTDRPLDDFHRRGRIRQAWCKTCRREYDAAYWQRTREARLQRRRARQAELERWHKDLKESTPCADCGRHFPHVAMHWDHLPGEQKRDDVSRLLHSGKVRLMRAEMAKCELVCATCHAVRTLQRARGV